MSIKKNQKIVSYICLLSLFSSNIYAMMPQDIKPKEEKFEIKEKEQTNKEKKYEPKPDEFTLNDLNPSNTDALNKKFNNIDLPNIAEENHTPTKSKLMLQDPKMDAEFKNHAYNELCPQSLKEVIKLYKKAGKEAFSNKYEDILSHFFVLYGPSGTGKSTLSILLAKELGIKLVFINSGFLGTMYRKSEEVNLSEKVAPLLENNIPCVVVIDEADNLIGKDDNDDNSNKNQSTALAQLIDMVEKNPNFILVWTTNNIDKIDSKFRDRIDTNNRIEVPLPNEHQRENILKYLIEKQKKSSKDSLLKITCEINDFNPIAKKTEGLSIRKLKVLLRKTIIKLYNQSAKTTNENEPSNIVLTYDSFDHPIITTKKDVADDKKAESNKNAKKFIKDYGLISVAITISCTILASGVGYIISKQSLEQAKAAQKQNIIMSIISSVIGGLGIAAATTIGIITLCVKKNK